MALEGDIDLTDNLDFYRERKEIIPQLPWEALKDSDDTIINEYLNNTFTCTYIDNSSTTLSYWYDRQWNNISTNSTIYTYTSMDQTMDLLIDANPSSSSFQIINSDEELAQSHIMSSQTYISNISQNNYTNTASYTFSYKFKNLSGEKLDYSDRSSLPWQSKKEKIEPYRRAKCECCGRYILGDICSCDRKIEESAKQFIPKRRKRKKELPDTEDFIIQNYNDKSINIKLWNNSADQFIDYARLRKILQKEKESDDSEYEYYFEDRYDDHDEKSIPWVVLNAKKKCIFNSVPWDKDKRLHQDDKPKSMQEEFVPWLKYLKSWSYSDYIEELELEGEKDYTKYLTDMGWLQIRN